MLDELERLALEANAENDDSSDWFCADLIESNELISSSRKARRYIAAANPATVLKLIAVARAAQRYFDGYCQDEAIDGEYVRPGQYGPHTGCGYAQATDALDLRTALSALKEPT